MAGIIKRGGEGGISGENIGSGGVASAYHNRRWRIEESGVNDETA